MTEVMVHRTRMHSSRMRTIHCSGRQGMSARGGVSAKGGVCPGVSARWCLLGGGSVCQGRGVCPDWVSAQGGVCPLHAGIPAPRTEFLAHKFVKTLASRNYLCGR